MPKKGLTIPDGYYYPEHKFVPGRQAAIVHEKRDEFLRVPLTKTEKRLIERMKNGKTPVQWARDELLKEARDKAGAE